MDAFAKHRCGAEKNILSTGSADHGREDGPVNDAMPPARRQADGADAPWDAIIVGTGMGGATIGHALAAEGFRVLFLEKGLDGPREDADNALSDVPDRRLGAGRWPDRISVTIDGSRRELFAPLGCGVGGSTLLFAGALERFERCDFESVPGLPHPGGGWPVGYDELLPYYERAERLYRVTGTGDPLGDPIALPAPARASAQDELFIRDFRAAGLHPYRLHVGIGYAPRCAECLGTICARSCKSDARHLCILPAVRDHGATVRAGCEAIRVLTRGRRAIGVEYREANGIGRAHGRVVILAAGTYRSAALLLLSATPKSPNGLANRSGQVGRNLMFHHSDWFALWPRRAASTRGPRKTIGLRDFYTCDGLRLGMMQSTGLSASYGNILVFLYQWFERSRWRRMRPLKPLLRVPAKIGSWWLGPATIFTVILEDPAAPENQVLPGRSDPTRIELHYQHPPEAAARARLVRRLLDSRLAGFRRMHLFGEAMLDLGHPTGGCRFGDDPATSVLDRNCRTHDIDNLYVVDGSFMPSSGGANPSLTIAANALRVGDVIAARLRGARTRQSATKGAADPLAS